MSEPRPRPRCIPVFRVLGGLSALAALALAVTRATVVTLAGIFLAVVLGGVVAVEIVFGIRGLGRLLIGSINRRDFPVIQGTVIVISFAFVFMNLIVDVLYTMINPRIQYGGGE